MSAQVAVIGVHPSGERWTVPNWARNSIVQYVSSELGISELDEIEQYVFDAIACEGSSLFALPADDVVIEVNDGTVTVTLSRLEAPTDYPW